ncbi:MAG: FAD-dependent oxidoreductase, partial [Planctomycetes bacterium]|nr:FAD-dependent oxidoreductase [Planctomycetota bacterium]
RDGGMTGCVIRDNDVYGPIYRHGRMGDRENLLRLSQACRLCEEPTCVLGCPAGIDIPQFIQQFLDGDERGAYETIRQANVFPEVCAWLCPVAQQCQGHCLENFIGDQPVPIAEIQRYLSERANESGWSALRAGEPSTGKKVAVIGAGPAGLACAAKLIEAGHAVTVFDKNDQPGGMVESVIPSDRIGAALNNEIQAVFKDVPAERLQRRYNVELTADADLDAIMDEGYDAAFIALGLSAAAGRSELDLDGLFNALEFLEAAKHAGETDVKDKRVAVIGGGNTAMDAAVTAKRLGGADVYLIYRRSFAEMPAWSAERDRAMRAGVNFLILTQQLEYLSQDGRVTGIRVCPTSLGESDDSGRRRPVPVESSTYDLEMDVVVEAMGQEAPADLDELLPGVKLTPGGLVATPKGSFATSRKGVFAGGDIVRGASTVVAAVADGMAAAREIDALLAR